MPGLTAGNPKDTEYNLASGAVYREDINKIF